VVQKMVYGGVPHRPAHVVWIATSPAGPCETENGYGGGYPSAGHCGRIATTLGRSLWYGKWLWGGGGYPSAGRAVWIATISDPVLVVWKMVWGGTIGRPVPVG